MTDQTTPESTAKEVKTSRKSTKPELDPESAKAVAIINAKRAKLRAVGAPVDGRPFGNQITNDERVQWAAFAFIKRVHKLEPAAVSDNGMALWQLSGKRMGIVQSASCTGGTVTMVNLPAFSESDFTTADFKTADAIIASLQ